MSGGLNLEFDVFWGSLVRVDLRAGIKGCAFEVSGMAFFELKLTGFSTLKGLTTGSSSSFGRLCFEFTGLDASFEVFGFRVCSSFNRETF